MGGAAWQRDAPYLVGRALPQGVLVIGFSYYPLLCKLEVI